MARPPHSVGRFPFSCAASASAQRGTSAAGLRRAHSWSSAPLRSSSAPSTAPWRSILGPVRFAAASSRGGSASIALPSALLRRNWHSSASSHGLGGANSAVADHQHQQQRTEKDEADERAEEAAEMGREDQHHTPPPPKSSVEGSANASGGAGMRRASKRKSAAATARLDDTDPEEARQREEEEEVRRLQQLRLERAEMGRGHGEDDRPRAREESKKCLAYCTADAYVLHKLYRALRADDVIAAEWKISYIRRDRKYIRLRCLDDSEIYIFPFGSFVCWDVDDADFIRVRQLIRACERGERTELYEDFDFAYGRDTAVDPEDDELILKEDDSTAKWPVSFALAQSIKLDYFEKEVKDTFQEMQALSHYLARNGSIPLGPKKIVQEMGKIMELLVNVNLGETDFVSDIPDEFWEDSESANTWKIFNSHLGVKNRAKVLDSQLKMFNDFYSMLSSEVHVKKSTRLEWAIIFLISIEVVFGVADHSDWLASFIP